MSFHSDSKKGSVFVEELAKLTAGNGQRDWGANSMIIIFNLNIS